MVHQYKNNGYNIVIDQNSASIHVVDDVAYDIIGMFEAYDYNRIKSDILNKYKNDINLTEEDFDSTYNHIVKLRDEKKLFSIDEYEDIAFEFKQRNSVIKAMCLLVAGDCNLSCKYCFAGEGEYCGERSLMSFETGKKALDYLLENSGTRHNLEVDFFGGEPLLNWDIVKKLVAYGRSKEEEYNKEFRFTLTTNGILLNDEIMEFANREMNNVVLSIDGRKATNDKMRSSKNGKGSYDIILPKFQRFAKSRGDKEYYVRATYTHYNLDFFNDIIHLADNGFNEISFEPVVAPKEADYSLKDEDLPEILEQYDKLAVEMLRREKSGNGFTFYHYMIDLTGGPCIVKRVSGCGVGMEYIAVTPNGDIYPCHQFTGDSEFFMGNVFTGINHPEIREKFKMCNVYSHDECKECFAKLYCSGGCPANAYHATGDVMGMYDFGCKLHKKRIECAIMIKVAEALGDNM